MWFVCKKLKFLRLIPVVFVAGFFCKISSGFASTTVTVLAASTVLVSTVADDDAVIFNGPPNGTLQIDTTKQLSSLTTAGVGIGNVDFTSVNTLTLTGIAGTSLNQINRINFGSFDGTLNIKGTTASAALGIITGTDNVGNLVFSGTSAQIVDSSIGSASLSGGLKLKSITVNNASGVTFSKNIYATTLTANENVIISGTGTVNVGTASIADSKTIALSNNAIFGSIETNVSGGLSFGANKILTITGNITGTGVIESVADDTGALVFSGTSAQTVATDIGSSSLFRISSATVNNSNGVTFSSDLHLNNFAVNESATINGSGVVDITLATIANSKILTLSNDASIGSINSNNSGILNFAANKTVTVTGNIIGTGAITTSTSNTGALSFTGITAQTVETKLELAELN